MGKDFFRGRGTDWVGLKSVSYLGTGSLRGIQSNLAASLLRRAMLNEEQPMLDKFFPSQALGIHLCAQSFLTRLLELNASFDIE